MIPQSRFDDQGDAVTQDGPMQQRILLCEGAAQARDDHCPLIA
jgi:hypothetical protein